MTRDMEIKNNLTVNREEVGEDNGGERAEGISGATVKDTWTKPTKPRGMEWGGGGWLGWGE